MMMEDRNLVATHVVSAGASVAFASSLTHPLDTFKSLLQVAASSRKQLSLSEILQRVRNVSGISGLYSGIGWATLARISGIGLRFGTYELLSAFYKDGREDDYVFVYEALLGGITAGFAEAIVNTPFELFKLRKQLSSTSVRSINISKAVKSPNPVVSKLLRGYTPDTKAWSHTLGLLSVLPSKSSNIIGAIEEYPWMLTGSGRPPLASDVRNPSNIISLEGWAALGRGLRSGIARDCIFGGVFFSTWQFLHIAMLDWKAADMSPPPRSIAEVGPVSPLAASVAAGISGSIAAAASHCFDTAKTRSQCVVVPKYVSMERKLMKWKAQGTWLERSTGISPADRGVLFRGIWFRMARSGVASYALVGSYLLAVDHLF